MLLTDPQIDELVTKLASLSGLDDQIVAQCSPLMRAGRHDAAVGAAFVVLEERLREALGVSGGTGRDLVSMAFNPETGRLRKRFPCVP